MIQLSQKQQEIADHVYGPLLVISTCGSGKTNTMTHRVVNMINKGVPENEIVVITFTKKAANEIKERIANLIKREHKAFVGTFHSFCFQIIKQEASYLGYKPNLTVADDSDQIELFKEICANDDSKLNYTVKDVILEIADFNNKNIEYDEHQRFYKIYQEYLNILKHNNQIDFDHIISDCIKLLKNDEIKAKYQEKYKYFIVDEFQDVNDAQVELLKILADKYENIAAIGDPNQTIYSFRGSNIHNILDFPNYYFDAKIIKLEENYRCSKPIVEISNNLIDNNTEKFDTIGFSNIDSNKEPIVKMYLSDQAEAEDICKQIQNLNPNETAILYRVNYLSKIIEQSLIYNKIPYKFASKTSILQMKYIKNLIAFLKFIYNNNDNISLLKIINIPRIRIGKVTKSTIEDLKTENLFEQLKSLKQERFKEAYKRLEKLTHLKDKPVKEIIDYILYEHGYKDYLESLVKDSDDDMDDHYSFEIIYYLAQKYTKLEEFLDNYELDADIISGKDGVSLLTIHKSKGLEFKNVFVIGVEKNILPLFKSENIEEERRLLYVAITRAKENLQVSYCLNRKARNERFETGPSAFIGEL